MKKILIFVALLTQSLLSTELIHVNMGNQDFSITTESYKIYDSKGDVMRLYKEERNNNLTYIFSFSLKDRSGACSDQSREDGHYEINANKITLYTRWERKGKAYDAPYGARIQVYEVQADHSIRKISSILYIETERENYNKASGMKYLFTAPKTAEERKKLQFYVDAVEHKYKGTFVFGDEAKILTDKVYDALQRKIKSTWK
jgi:hypothetical protein